jgi:hypothetical protein
MSTPSLPVRALDLLASEWTKFRSVRSTYWSLLVAVVTPVAVSAVVAFAFTSARNQGPPPDPLLPEVISLEYAVIAVSVMGVLAFSAEYSTGLIRVTFSATPRRRAVLAAKASRSGWSRPSWRATARACRWAAPGSPARCCRPACCYAYAGCSAWPSARSSGTPRAASPPPSR